MLEIGERTQRHAHHHPFWDVQRGPGGSFESYEPKHETHLHAVVEALLHDVSISKNLQFSRELVPGGGNLDFLVTGVLAIGELAKVCVEFKKAHAQDVLTALTTQLPAYMASHNTDHGVYAVMWFKGADFDQPARFDDQDDLTTDLNHELLNHGLSLRIRPVILDVSRPSATPSTA